MGRRGMSEGTPEGMASGMEDAAASAGTAGLETFDKSFRDFAEGATALTAASLRLQMLMLEQMREMLGDISLLAEGAMRGENEDD